MGEGEREGGRESSRRGLLAERVSGWRGWVQRQAHRNVVVAVNAVDACPAATAAPAACSRALLAAVPVPHAPWPVEMGTRVHDDSDT
jgi:hypothetical protein